MTTVAPRPCYSLFSDDNKFSLSKLNGGEPLAVTAFVLEPVPAVAIVDESEYEDSDEESGDEESSDEESSDEENEVSELAQIVTYVEREPPEPDQEEKEEGSDDDEQILLGAAGCSILTDLVGNARPVPESDARGSGSPGTANEAEERREVAAALASIAEYEDEKFTELAEQLKKAKLLKNAGLINDAEVQVDLGWTRMVLYIR